ncbi:TRAP transporter large permease [Allosediminivita pacifica]|uniref:TRAP transporter large permease protein n=1 Tax=Allosediminivita pacifica TaxID=1267769 RepID=A0A2T6ANI6_9RHOB|nr:TRAP transporter large permease [Allosediminivita pacifica]PTX45384.1 tripartite ATP-independent transporter DctM subunit [Allosediminivita pacifica]GGB20860.1 C4-dicarboxylate ABC transporter [Allosediminivita pacifica]
MDASTAGLLVVAVLMLMLIGGVYIGVALGLAGMIGIWLTSGASSAFAQLATIPFSTTNSFTLAVIPLFIFMGSFATQANLTTDLYRAAYKWLGHLHGGLAIATNFASAMFGAASGSTIVNAAVFTRMSMPEMTALGYSPRLAAGCIAASGTLAALIPPSVLMVIYAVITEQSVAKVMIAGLVPGILTACVFAASIYVRALRNPDLAPTPVAMPPLGERVRSLRGVWGITILFVLVIGGIYGGFFTATSAGAFGAFGAMLIVIAKGRLNLKSLMEIIKEASISTTTIFIIVIGGMLFARFVTYTGLITDIVDWSLALELPRLAYLLGFILLFLVLGMFIEPIAIMVMTLPIIYPIMTSVGYDPIWLGIIAVKMAEISLCTPPVGLNVYIVRASSPVPLALEDVFAGVTPFLLMEVLILALLIIFPEIVTFVPDLMD